MDCDKCPVKDECQAEKQRLMRMARNFNVFFEEELKETHLRFSEDFSYMCPLKDLITERIHNLPVEWWKEKLVELLVKKAEKVE